MVGSSSSEFEALALRLGITGSMSFEDVIQCVVKEEQFVEGHPIPFSELMDALRPKTEGGESSTEPLCQVRFFNMVDVREKTLEAVGTCDWTVFVEQKADAKRILPLKIRISYNSVLFKEARMVELLNQIQFVTEQVVTNPKILVDDVSLVTNYSRSIIPDPTHPLSDKWEGSIQSFLASNAEKIPDRTFVCDYDGKTYSFKDINAKANKVANFLIEKGNIQIEDVVAIFAHRSSPLVVAIMGVLKSGATVCIIDPQYPPKRQITYLEVAQPKALIVLEEAGNLQEEVKDYLIKTPKIATVLRGLQMDLSKVVQLESVSEDNPKVEVSPHNIGTLSFTSGSTGIPKGCRGRHISLTHFYPWMGTEFNLSEKDRFTMLSGIAHDPIQRDIFTPIFFGAELRIPTANDILEPGRLAVWCAENEVTVTHLTPAMGQLLTADASAQIPSLRNAFFVGDVLTKRDCTRLQHLAPNVDIVNMYGTTETQRSVSYVVVKNDASMQEQKAILPAGRGMKDVQLLILNSKMKMAGIGEAGEIYVRSHCMAAGYLGLEEATAEKFLPNPFVKDSPTDRFYKTGDVGRYLPNGIVECMGRADDQIKLRGFRIELREIDTFLVQHPLVREAVTLCKRDQNEEHLLVSYFVPQDATQEVSIDVLKAHLKEKLPSYAIPSVFVKLAKFPLTPNGKIDKQKLPFKTAQAAEAKTEELINKNLTNMESIVKNTFKATLPQTSQTLDESSNFFDFGGHSISATRVIFNLRKTLQLQEIPLDLIYANPTIKSLAAAIESNYLFEVSSASSKAVKEKEAIDLSKEISLDDKIVFDSSAEFPQAIKGVFLTGSTGFLGAFLLRDLLDFYAGTKVYCLVRCADEKAGKDRVLKNLEDHQILKSDHVDRIVALKGSLEKKNFGLSDQRYKEMAEQTQMVIHNGAVVHWVHNYEKLKGANVTGTVEALKLAQHGNKPFYFISSTAVFETLHYQNMALVPESDPLDNAGNMLTTGYAQTKYVSEKLIFEAQKRGAKASIIRPGYITGDSKSGVTNSDDFLWRLISGCIELKKCPKMRNKLNTCPVDFVSSLIVKITASPKFLGKSYHTINPNIFRFDDFFDQLVQYGWDVEGVSYVNWRRDLQDLTLNSQNNALFPLLHFVLDDLPTKSRAPVLDDQNSKEVCEEFDMRCPAMTKTMGLYLSYLVSVNFIPKPPKEGALKLPEIGKGTLLSRHQAKN